MPMNSQEIKNLTQKGESETLEFKSSLSDWRAILETISAFANTKGGKILIGVEKTGNIKGITIGKRTIEDIANKITRNTDPKIYPSIKAKKINDKKIIIIEVEESTKSKPVFAFDRVYKRIGRTNQRLTSEKIRILIQESQKTYWDEQISKEAKKEDIDWNFVKEIFIPLYEETSNKKIVGRPSQVLESLGCTQDNKITNAGILLFGKNPQEYFRKAYIALARYRGKDVSVERLDYKEFTGNLFRQITKCNDFIIDHIAVMSRLQPGKVRREDIPEYGRFSIRELITNAVCHRDYSDQGSKVIIKMFDNKIEFYNPGGLPKGITPKNITEKQYSRNPIIAGVLAKVEYIEELGEGWDKIIREHKTHPLKPKLPLLKADKYSILVTLFSSKDKFGKERRIELTPRQKKVLTYLKREGRITTSLCAGLLKVSSDTALRELTKLIQLEMITRKGRGKGVHYTLR